MSRTIFEAPIDVSRFIFDWRDRERNSDVLTVTAHALGFEMFDPLSLFKLAMILSSSAIRSGGITSEMWLTYSLFGSETKELFCGGIPALDDAVK